MDTKEINAAVKCAVETTQQPPSFFIHGSSVFALETEAVKTAETLKRCENMFFRGIVKYFSIKMPYFSDMAGSENFLARLDESMNTAADFYSEFKGVVIIELSEEWAKKGINNAFSCLPGYIGMHKCISYIVIIEAEKESASIDDMRRALNGSTIWIDIRMKTAEIGQCINLFFKTAKEVGMTVSDAASKELKKTLENADVSVLPLDQVVLRTVQQIKLNKQVKNANLVIEAGDLDIMPQKRTCERRGRIGFSAKE